MGYPSYIDYRKQEADFLGQLPEHWNFRRLRFTAPEPLMYGANEAAVSDDRSLPRYIRITDVNSDGTLNEDTFRSLTEELAIPYLLQEGDILLARSGATWQFDIPPIAAYLQNDTYWRRRHENRIRRYIGKYNPGKRLGKKSNQWIVEDFD